MFLLITFLFISLFNLKGFERNTNKMSNKNLLNLLLPENPLVIFIQKKVFPHWSQKKKTSLLSLLSIVSPLGYPTNWFLRLGELLHALYFNGSTLSLTIMASKIYLMMRIKGDVFF